MDRAEEARTLSTREFALRPRLKERYEELCLREELKWKQRSRVNWLKAGDANTKFFHSRANARRNANLISRLTDGGAVFADHASLAGHLLNFFTSQMGTAAHLETSIDFQRLFTGDSFDLRSLHDPFTEEEVRGAVFSCAPDKAPGPDGFPMLFYQRFWGLVKGDLLEVFDALHSGQCKLDVLNQGWICLIPKKSESTSVRDYRPISLINGLPKLLSKVLASRLQRFLEVLVNPYQAAFIKGRSLLDNFYTAHILSHHLHSTNRKAALLKIDFERAFDHINWRFLADLLLARGSGNTWVSWISAILQSSSTAVLLNGVPGTFFQCRRGLRQGDPLSPLLFILCIDVLFRMLHSATAHSLLPPVGVGEATIHTLQFADNLLIFFDGSSRAAGIIKFILGAFSAASGLRINFSKSSCTPIHLDGHRVEGLVNTLGCPLLASPLNTWTFLCLRRRCARRTSFPLSRS